MKAGRGAPGVAALALLVMLAGCGDGDPRLMNIRAEGNGPDEFGILPPKPLAMPESLSDLPPPTPGGANRTDPTPTEDAIVALGGRPGAGAGADAALVGHVTRYGLSGDIRRTLAEEDLAFRTDNRGRILERLFNVNVYFRAYAEQSLDQQAELARWRRAGVRTVSAPPPQDGE
ncbi:MAG TPA: DUF3035 domain-containing protein [Paracoccaceae bacterium]|nr:DUF3035 domain-containing protein [Paracoccaceae bacterium]